MDLEQHIAFVNEMRTFQLSQAKRFAAQPNRANLHLRSAEKFGALAADLERLAEIPRPLVPTQDQARETEPLGSVRLSLVYEEIEGLPDELLAELSISDSDRAEFTIVELIDGMGGVATLDRLLVALYKKTGEITKRLALNQRLYRMAQREQVYSVPNKKGVYSTRPLSEEEVAKLK